MLHPLAYYIPYGAGIEASRSGDRLATPLAGPVSKHLAAEIAQRSRAGMAMNVIIAVFAARTSGQFSGRLDETATALPCIACATDDQSSAGSRDGALLV